MHTEIEGPPIVKQALETISHYDETKRAITEKDAHHRLSDEEVPSEGIAKYCSHASDLTILLSLFLSVDKCISIWDIKKMCQSSRTYHLLQQNNIITTMILLICTWNLKSHLFNNYQLSMFKWPLNGLGRLSITHGDSLTMVSFYLSYKIDNWMPKRTLRQSKYIRQN